MKFFSLDNPLWNFIGKLLDAIVLHVLWLVCSLPIITFGASTTALFYAMMRDTSEESGHFIKDFFHSFKQNFKQGILFGLLFLLLFGGLIFAIIYYGKNESLGVFGQILKVISFVALVFTIFIFEYAFPLLARFNNTTFQTLRNGMLFSVKHIGWTIVMAAAYVIWYVLLLSFPEIQIFWPIFGFALPVYVNSYMLTHILKPYIDKALEDERATDISEEAVLAEEKGFTDPALFARFNQETAAEDAKESTAENTTAEVQQEGETENTSAKVQQETETENTSAKVQKETETNATGETENN